ncbi:MAG: hypothetical protein KGL10_07485 [Alphaproteobacteria bacterium]|nr:hypothetical protein [Alphaproteobacteria bacterium]MDE2337137.1 hypothetical protein [Alphaproteobacteria bacterium]
MWLYAIAALGALAQYAMSWQLVIAGCLVVSFCGFMIKAQRITARDTIYASHVEWTANTLRIGGYYLLPLSLLLTMYLVDRYTNINGLFNLMASSNGDLSTQVNTVQSFMNDNSQRIDFITTLCITPPIFWWVWRCWFGLWRAQNSEPIDFPDAFF